MGQKNKGIGILSITEHPECYLLSSGNKIHTSKVAGVVERCEYINSLDKEGLRSYYRSERTISFHLKRTKGAYLGFIDMARRSQNPLQIKVNQIDDELSFFSIVVKVNKPEPQPEQDKKNNLTASA